MTTLVLYDSAYGNTAKVAQAIAEVIGAQAMRATDVRAPDWSQLTLLVVGSPTQGGRPTQALQAVLSAMTDHALANIWVAAFDTRFALNEHGFALKLVMKTVGYAANRIAKVLIRKGGSLAVQPEGFIVTGKEGPLKDGELERAKQWANTLTRR